MAHYMQETTDNVNPCRDGFVKFPLQPIVYCCSHREGFPGVDTKLHLPLAATGVSANSTSVMVLFVLFVRKVQAHRLHREIQELCFTFTHNSRGH